MLDTIGSTVGWQFVPLMETLLSTHPATSREPLNPSADHEPCYTCLLDTCYDIVPLLHPAVLEAVLTTVILPQLEAPSTTPALLPILMRFALPMLNRSHGIIPAPVLIKLLHLRALEHTPLHIAAGKLLNTVLVHSAHCLDSKAYLVFVQWAIGILGEDPQCPPSSPLLFPAHSSSPDMKELASLCQSPSGATPKPSAPLTRLQHYLLELLAALARRARGLCSALDPGACTCPRPGGSDLGCGCDRVFRASDAPSAVHGPNSVSLCSLLSARSAAPSASLCRLLPVLFHRVRGTLANQDKDSLSWFTDLWQALEALTTPSPLTPPIPLTTPRGISCMSAPLESVGHKMLPNRRHLSRFTIRQARPKGPQGWPLAVNGFDRHAAHYLMVVAAMSVTPWTGTRSDTFV